MTSPNSKPHIVIVGGAIAGAALAAALRDIAGTIDVLEQNASPDEMDLEQGGAGLALLSSSNAILQTDLLKPGGLKRGDVRSPEFEGEGNMTRLLGYDSANVLMAIPNPGEAWTVHRKTFAKVLYDVAAANSNVKFHWSARVAPDGVDTAAGSVRTTDGRTFQGDLVVGCDGVRSSVRQAVLRAHGLPQPTSKPLGVSCARWSLPDEQVPASSRESLRLPSDARHGFGNSMYHCPHNRLVSYRMRNDGLLNSLVYYLDADVPSELSKSSADAQAWRQSGTAVLAHLAESGKVKPAAPVVDLLRAPQQAGLWQLRSLPPLPTWSHGKTLLIGDAAHPMAPFQASGAAMAIEDVEAFVNILAGGASLSQASDDLYRLRFLRTSIVQAISDHTPFPQDLLQQSRAHSQQAENKTDADDSARQHHAFVEARKRVDDAMRAHNIDLSSPTVVRFAMVYPGAKLFAQQSPKLIIGEPVKL